VDTELEEKQAALAVHLREKADAQRAVHGVWREPRFSMGEAAEHAVDGVRSEPLHYGPFVVDGEPSPKTLDLLDQHFSQLGPNQKRLRAAIKGAEYLRKLDVTRPEYDEKLAALQRDENGNRRWAAPVSPDQIAEDLDRRQQLRELLPVDLARLIDEAARAEVARQQEVVNVTRAKIPPLEKAVSAASIRLDEQLIAGIDRPDADPWAAERELKTEQRRLKLQTDGLEQAKLAAKMAGDSLREAEADHRRSESTALFEKEEREVLDELEPLLLRIEALQPAISALGRHTKVIPAVVNHSLGALRNRIRTTLELLLKPIYTRPDGASEES
jgi:hypothetical protein